MKVCLIGNNLTSLILAKILNKKKINVQIYSSKSTKLKFNTRTLGVTDYNLKYLSTIFKNISILVNPINKIKILIEKNETKEKIIFDKKSLTLFNMVKYEKLLSYVRSKVLNSKKIKVSNIRKKLDLFKIVNKRNFDLIINCEKSNIFTKKYLKNGIFKNYYNSAFTTIIKHHKLQNNQAVQVFTDNGPLAFLPLTKEKTSIVYSVDIKKKNNLSQTEFKNIINKYNPSYKIISYGKIENFSLNLILPKNYCYENILFFGDSIHSIHPLAGQGFNMTIRDIIELDKILEKKLNLGLNIDKHAIHEFEKQVKSYNSIFSFGIDFIHEFFIFDKKFIPKKISKLFFNYINRSSKIKNLGIKIANQGTV